MFPVGLPPFVPAQFTIAVASGWEREGYHRLRREVFCTEQQLFCDDDRDAIDECAIPIVALALVIAVPDAVVGTVRIHESARREWWGSRLAIRADVRGVAGLGAGLVHRAVTTAIERGCDVFSAHVQRQNVGFFRRLRWEAIEERELHGHPHMLMRADLDAYRANGFARLGRAS